MLDVPNSFNNRLIVEAYTHTELRQEVRSGWATVSQRNNLKGLTVLVQAHLNDGTVIPKGSIAYIREELLHTHPFAKNKLKCDTIPGEFIIVNMNEVEYVSPPPHGAA